jgi:hypothetical protein
MDVHLMQVYSFSEKALFIMYKVVICWNCSFLRI